LLEMHEIVKNIPNTPVFNINTLKRINGEVIRIFYANYHQIIRLGDIKHFLLVGQ
jgi:hypothetical protein